MARASTVRVIAEAAEEIVEAEAYYRQRSRDAADAFLGELRRALALISESPETWPLVRRDARRVLLRRYPYGVVYRLRGTLIEVIAVAHAKRRPFYWRDR